MNERITKIKRDITTFWKSRTKTQKGTIIGSVVSGYCTSSYTYIFF